MEVTESPRIEELRRRVQKDPTSIAFAQLAEEYRRVGNYDEAVQVCRDGLARHPSYLSARVTLGRALMELEQFDDAQAELDTVLDLAPDNLAAIRALAEIHQRRGETGEMFHPQPLAEQPHAAEPVTEEAPPAPVVTSAGPVLETAPDVSVSEVETTFQIQVDQPAEVPAHVETPAPADIPPVTPPNPLAALDALAALTLDLPPPPDFSSWSLDTDFSLDAAPATGQAPSPPAIAPSTPAPDPVVEKLERWLAAIVADRSARR